MPGLGRFPGERSSNPLQYFCLENSTHRGVCRLQSVGFQSQTWQKLTHTTHTYTKKGNCSLISIEIGETGISDVYSPLLAW